MTALMTLFWRLAIFRASPENAPYSTNLLGLVLLGWCGLQLLVGSLQTALPVLVLLSSQLISMAVILAGIFVLLGFKGLQSRWLQTALSLVGIDVVLTLVTLPLLAINAGMAQSQGWIEGLYLLLVSWQLAAQSTAAAPVLSSRPAQYFHDNVWPQKLSCFEDRAPVP
ncbi:MAG: hypothetical protein ACPHM2_05985 [Alcanivorax sp.]